jgi:tetratricopeptide (TPR) repeat protein
LANLYFLIGRIDDAGKQYQASLGAFPRYVHALAGLGRVAAANGDLTGAVDHYTRAIEVVPLPEYVIALGDVYAAAGDTRNADAQYALVGAIEQLYAANGVNLDLQIGMFNADHDRDVASTVARTKAAYTEQPSIQAADALAWVQYKAGDVDAAMPAIEQALRTGTRDPLILFHAGMIYRRAGNPARAIAYLAAVEGENPQFSILQAPVAREALRELTGEARAPGN